MNSKQRRFQKRHPLYTIVKIWNNPFDVASYNNGITNIRIWLNKNVPKRKCAYRTKVSYHSTDNFMNDESIYWTDEFSFSNEEHAVLFSLRWL